MGYGVLAGGQHGAADRCMCLLCPADFAGALGSGLSDKCSGEPVPAAGPVRSRTARCLQRLYPALACALRCLRLLPACLPGEWGLEGGMDRDGHPGGPLWADPHLALAAVTPPHPLPPPRSPPRLAMPAPAGAGLLPGHGAGCLLLADGQSLPVPGSLGSATVPARHPGGPAGTQGTGDGDPHVRGWTLPQGVTSSPWGGWAVGLWDGCGAVGWL